MAFLAETEPRPLAADLKKYRALNPLQFSRARALAQKLKGLPVIHISSAARGGGVAELLHSQVRFERELGLASRWLVIEAPLRFFEVTKKIHNLLQGHTGSLSAGEVELYFDVNKELGGSLKNILKKFGSGIVVIHDPQPLPLVHHIPPEFLPILRLHIDLSTPNPTIVEFLRPFITRYQKVVISNDAYRPALPWADMAVVYPAIDPFSEKNTPMPEDAARRILEQFGINCTHPLVTQVSRFDPWKDPLGVIHAYYLAKNEIPELQLVLEGFILAKDDPEAQEIFQKVKKHARGDPDIFLFSNPETLREISADKLVSALYTVSTVIIQKSIREGFGLTMTEAMWKEKALVAGLTQGALVQVKNGENGILVSSPEEAAKALVRLLKNEKLRRKLGKAARRAVEKNFLLPRFVLDNLKIYQSALEKNRHPKKTPSAYLTPKSSTSKTKVAPGGIAPGTPRSP